MEAGLFPCKCIRRDISLGDCKDERRRLFEWVTFDSACVARGVLSIVNYTETAKFVTENERDLVW